MQELNKPDPEQFFCAYDNNGVFHFGKVSESQVVTTGLPYIVSDSELESFLSKVQALGYQDIEQLREELTGEL